MQSSIAKRNIPTLNSVILKEHVKKSIAVIGLKGLPAFGGAAAVGESIIDNLINKYDITVYSVSSHTHLKTGEYKGYTQIVFKAFKSKSLNTLIYYLKSLFHVLFATKYDIIHLHHAESGFITPFLRLKYKVVVTFHGIYRDDYIDSKFSKLSNKFFRFSERLNVRFANEVISVSKPDADYCYTKYLRELRYIPNGIQIENIQDNSGIQKPYLVFAAGRIYDIKGLHLLLEAMHINNDKRKLLVVGDTDQVPQYTNKIKVLAEGLDVDFVGLIREKHKLFELVKGADLFIFRH